MSKKVAIIIIQCVFLICPILWLVFKVDYESVAKALKSLSLYLIIFLIILNFIRFTLQSLRFWVLITPFSGKIKPLEFVILDWKARYYAIIMPSSAGQDITRAFLLKKHLSMEEILAISIFFRVTGIIMFVFISMFGFFRLYSEQNISAAAICIVIVLSALCAVSTISLSEKATKKLLSMLPKKTPKKIVSFLENFSQAILLYKKFPKLVIFNLLFALILHILYILFPIISIYAICGEIKIIEIFTFIPLIEIFAAAVPFAPSGAGIREGLIILFFNIINQTKEQAFSYITLYTMSYLMPFFGFFVIVFEKMNKKRKNS